MKKLKDRQAFILLESLFAFSMLSATVFLLSLTFVQFYQQEHQLLQNIDVLMLADACVIAQKAVQKTDSATIYYKDKEVKIDEKNAKTLLIYMLE